MSFYIYYMNEEGIGPLLRRIFRLGYGRRLYADLSFRLCMLMQGHPVALERRRRDDRCAKGVCVRIEAGFDVPSRWKRVKEGVMFLPPKLEFSFRK